MRKVIVLVISLLLIASLTPAVLAEPKPAPDYIPHPLDVDLANYTFDDYWIELNPDDGGNGYELPGDGYSTGALGWIRGGGWGWDPTPPGQNLYHGLPIGFNFKFMQGPAEGSQEYAWFDDNKNDEVDPGEVRPVDPDVWMFELTDNGWDEIWVGTKGYVAFHEPVADLGQLSAIKWNQMPSEIPLPWPPNNMIAPYLTDLAIGDNDFDEVTSVGFDCTSRCAPGPNQLTCNATTARLVSGPDGCVDRFPPGDPRGECNPVTGYWTPCSTQRMHVPRGRLLYRTVGDAPNRKFVVEWANAKVYWGSGFATFELQVLEGSNIIAFLFKDFKPLAFFEDPPHAAAFPLWDTLVVGMEDSFGTTGVGQAYGGTPDFSPDGWAFFNPLNELDIMAFCADAYACPPTFTP